MRLYTYYDSPVGRLLLECDGTAPTGPWLENQNYYATWAVAVRNIDDTQPVFDAARTWLNEYFTRGDADGPHPSLRNWDERCADRLCWRIDGERSVVATGTKQRPKLD